MPSSFEADLGIHETDPARKCVLLMLCMADADDATAVVFGPPNGSRTPTRYLLDNAWYDFPLFPVPMPTLAAELERMAGLSESSPEGVLEHTFDGAKLRWKVQATAPGAEYLLTRITDQHDWD